MLEVHLAGEPGTHVATGADRQERQPRQHTQIEAVRVLAHETGGNKGNIYNYAKAYGNYFIAN